MIVFHFTETQIVCASLLGMWSILFGKYCHSNVDHESIFRWRISFIWMACHEFIGYSTRTTIWSNGVCVSSHYKMYIPQIWCIRINTKTRFIMHTSIEYCQRENIYIHLVLVYNSIVPANWIGNLSVSVNYSEVAYAIYVLNVLRFLLIEQFVLQTFNHIASQFSRQIVKYTQSFHSTWNGITYFT